LGRADPGAPIAAPCNAEKANGRAVELGCARDFAAFG
jgi:hypothetical protein